MALIFPDPIFPDWASLDTRLRAAIEQFGASACSSELVFDGQDWLHITASARVLNPHRTRVLRVWNAKNGAWQLPGAHGEGDFDLLSVAHREANRASGCECQPLSERANEVAIQKIAEYWNTPAHLHFEVVWEFRCEETELPRGARWFVRKSKSASPDL